jgi:hypothetical protein
MKILLHLSVILWLMTLAKGAIEYEKKPLNQTFDISLVSNSTKAFSFDVIFIP